MQRVGKHGYLSQQDGLESLRGIRDEVADVVFLDPPFNLGKDYGIDSTLELAEPGEYETYLRGCVVEVKRILRPGGALFLYHLPYWASRVSATLLDHLEFRHWIAITMKNGFVRGNRLYPAHYALLYYTKGKPGHFVRPKLEPATCRKCGETVKDYGGYRTIIENKGINLSDVWDDVSPVRHAANKHRAANELPMVITDRVVGISGAPGALLVDPFCGTGTSLASAVGAGLNFVGNDLSGAALAVARKRIH